MSAMWTIVRRFWPAVPAMLVLVRTASCGNGAHPIGEPAIVPDIEADGPGYLRADEPIADGWTVPDGTVLLGSAYPQAAAPDRSVADVDDGEYLHAELLLTGNSYAALRDLIGQADDRGLSAVTSDEYVTCGSDYPTVLPCGGDDTAGCMSDGGSVWCAFDVIDDSQGGADKELGVQMRSGDEGAGAPWPKMEIELDIAVGGRVQSDMPEPMRKLNKGLIDDPQDFHPLLTPAGQPLKMDNRDSPGDVPDGATMLAPPTTITGQTGLHTTFTVTDDAADALGDLVAGVDPDAAHDTETIDAGGTEFTVETWSGPACVSRWTTWTNPHDARIGLVDVACESPDTE